MPQKILVTGSRGNLGSAVSASLSKKGFEIKASSTEPGTLTPVEHVEPVRLAYEAAETHDRAFEGVDRLFLIAPPMDPAAPEKLHPIIDKAKEKGVEHVVFNSALGVDQNEEAPLRVIERYLMNSGLNYTILRPNFFMENFSTGFAGPMITELGGIFLAAAEGKTSFISTRDIADVAAIAFQKKMYAKEYNLTGSEALDHDEVARIIGEVSGKAVKYHALSEDEMLQGARDNGMPEGHVQYMGLLYSLVRDGYMAAITGDVEKATGHKPLTFQQFAGDNADRWK
jgi:uncharacterized protein YbjT (DUF2867 family)